MTRKRFTPALVPVLAAAIFAGNAVAAELPPLARQWQLANSKAVKLVARNDGWQGLTQKRLVAAGLDRTAPAASLRLYAEGREVPLRVGGIVDGRLGSRGWIQFYGRGLDLEYTDARTYWLVWGGEPGLRVPRVAPSASSRGVAESYDATTSARPRSAYYGTVRNGDEENIFGPQFRTGSPASQTIFVSRIDRRSTQQPVLEVRVQGFSLLPHKVDVALNGTQVAHLEFARRDQGRAVVPVLPDLVKEGENVVTFKATAGDLDINEVDRVLLTYRRLYQAINDELTFPVPARKRAVVGGFSTRRLLAVDVTDPRRPHLLQRRVVRASGGFAVRLAAADADRRITVSSEARIRARKPVVEAERPSAWHEPGAGADLVIISHRDFIPALTPLVQLRQSQGLKVALVDVEDVYDEFSYGVHGPEAIKQFLTLAGTEWRHRPRAVLLVGDATYDPRNYLKLGQPDFVPAKNVDTPFGEIPTDDWYVDRNDDGLPELAIGRLPVATPQEAATVVGKIVSYSWSRLNGGLDALLVADRNDGTIDFEGETNGLRPAMPSSWSVEMSFRGRTPARDTYRSALLQQLNRGPRVVSFIGHGAVTLWGRDSFLDWRNPFQLTNADRLSFYVVTTCLNAYFVNPTLEGLAESLIQMPNGGAVATLSSSGFADAFLEIQLDREVLRAAASGQEKTLGDAILKAKAAVPDSDVRRTAELFGDPTTPLG